MGLYYNRTQSSVPVTLSGGRSILIPAKGREVLHGEDESAPALLQAISSQKIVRLPDAYASKVEGASTPVVAPSLLAETSPPSEVSVAAPVAGVPELGAPAESEPEPIIEPHIELAPSDDGSSSTGAASATPAEQSTRADGPRRERRK